MLWSGTDPESYITEYTLVYEDKPCISKPLSLSLFLALSLSLSLSLSRSLSRSRSLSLSLSVGGFAWFRRVVPEGGDAGP